MRNISIQELPGLCNQIADRLNDLGFVPSTVLYIESGGWLIGQLLGLRFGCQTVGVQYRRRGHELRTSMGRFLRHLPAPVLTALRKLDLRVLSLLPRDRRGLARISPDIQAPILIVDDVVDTGLTMSQIEEVIRAHGIYPELIRSAVIGVTRDSPSYSPDVRIFASEICRFPWSNDSPELGQYLKLRESVEEEPTGLMDYIGERTAVSINSG